MFGSVQQHAISLLLYTTLLHAHTNHAHLLMQNTHTSPPPSTFPHQGLTPAARQQVLMLSLSALETITTRDHQQPLSSRHVIAEASCMACRAMLGVVLPELAQQARDAMMEQRGGDVAMGEQEGMEDHGAAKMQAQNAWLDDWQSDDEQDSATDTRGKSTSQAQEQQQPPSGQWVGTLWQSAEGKMGLYDGAMKKAVGMLEAEQGQHTEEQRSSQDVGTDSLMYTRHGNHSNDVTGGTHGEGGMSIREQALAAVQQPPVTLRCVSWWSLLCMWE